MLDSYGGPVRSVINILSERYNIPAYYMDLIVPSQPLIGCYAHPDARIHYIMAEKVNISHCYYSY